MTTSANRGHFTLRGRDRSQATYSVRADKTGYKFPPERVNVTSPAEGNVDLNFTATGAKAK